MNAIEINAGISLITIHMSRMDATPRPGDVFHLTGDIAHALSTHGHGALLYPCANNDAINIEFECPAHVRACEAIIAEAVTAFIPPA